MWYGYLSIYSFSLIFGGLQLRNTFGGVSKSGTPKERLVSATSRIRSQIQLEAGYFANKYFEGAADFTSSLSFQHGCSSQSVTLHCGITPHIYTAVYMDSTIQNIALVINLEFPAVS